MMKRFFLTLMVSAFLLLPFSVKAVELEKSFEVSFEFDGNGLMVVNSYDDNGIVDGYIVYGGYDKFYSKYDLNDRLVWKKTDLTMNDFKVVSDNNDLVIKKINTKDNSIIWQEKFGGNGNERVGDVFYDYDTKDNVTGYLIIVTTDSTDLDVDPGHYIMKYDLDGKLLWIKKDIYEDNYVKDSNGDWLKYNFLGSHGWFDYAVYNITRNLSGNTISAGKYWLPVLLINRNTSSNLILIYNNYDKGILEFGKYTLLGDKISTKEFDISNSIWFPTASNSKSIYGEYDGLILCSTSNNSENAILKFDYDGNLIWKKELSYEPSFIAESYDETGEFNGYIVTGYDKVNKKGYITKFTYPKKVIESKNSDVEVISDAYPGKTVTVKAKEKTGYVVKRIIVKDSSGKEIEVSNDGTFIMPDDDVSIEVVYEKKVESIIINPDTASTLSIVLIIISIVIIGSVIVGNRKYLER